MVSTTSKENGLVENGLELGLPKGKYQVVGWDLDTTGRRLIDEICQIAAYTQNSKFSQYVMPFRDLDFAAKKRHNIKVVNFGRYRMLKDIKTKEILRTKSEISALTDFLDWLEKLGAPDGVILLSHEPRKVIASLLLEALRRYNLQQRFSAVVKGFVNGFSIAELKCAKTVRSFSLRTLSHVLLDKDEYFESAVDRARLAYQVAQHLCGEEKVVEVDQGSGDASTAGSFGLADSIRSFVVPVSGEEEQLAALKIVIDRQNTLRPVFLSMMRQSRRDAQRASNLRRLLATAGVDYKALTVAHTQNGKQGIHELLNTEVRGAKPKDIDELLNLLINHFEELCKPKAMETTTSNASSSNESGTNSPEVASSTPDVASTSPTQLNDSGTASPTALQSPPNEEANIKQETVVSS